MSKLKLYAVLALLLITVGGYVGYRVGHKDPVVEPKSEFNVLFEDKTVQIKQLNHRGDMQIKTPSKNIIVKEKGGKHKLSLLALNLSTEPIKIGYCFEVLHWGDFNLSVGINTHTPYVGVGYSVNKYSEFMVGMGTTPVIGFGARIE